MEQLLTRKPPQIEMVKQVTVKPIDSDSESSSDDDDDDKPKEFMVIKSWADCE
jgi:hypothetical protein